MTEEYKSKFDFSGIDTRAIDPDALSLGTNQSDCALIAQTFERGAHATPTEAAVFATLSRNIQNNKQFAIAASDSMSTYLGMPQEDAQTTAAEAAQFASDVNTNGGGGSSAQTNAFMQSLNIGTQKQSTYGPSFGEQLLEYARDCIPCDLRIMAFLELHPNIDLLGVLEEHLKKQLQMLIDIGNLLNNFNIYGDFCELLNLLSFMCIPDLQRIIATLMALFTLQVPQLDGLIGMLQGLIVPLFAPILMAITSLLDQFSVLVTNPLECVIDAIRQQLRKLNVETPDFSFDVTLAKENPLSQISGGLEALNFQLQDGVQTIKNKLKFYIDQVQAMLAEMGGGDSAYLEAKLAVLQLVRMISFVVAIITALTKGHLACSSTGQPSNNTEIDNFFRNFLNPQSPFDIWIDEDGEIHIDEDLPNFTNIVQPPNTRETLKEFGNVLQFEGEPLLDIAVAQAVDEAVATLTTSAEIIIPCKLEITASNVEKINQWITELNQT